MIDEGLAYELVGRLCVATSGWDDVAVELYATELAAGWSNADAARAAVAMVARTWREARRPPLGVLLEQYRLEANRIENAEASNRYLPRAEQLPLPHRRRILAEAARLMGDKAWIDEHEPPHSPPGPERYPCPRCSSAKIDARWPRAVIEATRRVELDQDRSRRRRPVQLALAIVPVAGREPDRRDVPAPLTRDG